MSLQDSEGPKKWLEQELLYNLDIEIISLWRTDKTEFGLGVVNDKEVTRKIRVSLTRLVCWFLCPQFPVSGYLNVFLPLGSGRLPSPWKFYDLFQGRRVREEQARVDFSASAIFLTSFSLKYSICQGTICWNNMSWISSELSQKMCQSVN